MAFDKQKYKIEMKRAGVTQQQLAEMHGVHVRQVSRWLNSKGPLKSEKIRDLCDSIGREPQDFDDEWEGTFDTHNTARVSAKISSASKNAYWLLKQKFGVTETQIVELAPTLFAMFAGATIEQFQKGENDIAKKAVEILAEQFGIDPEATNHLDPSAHEYDAALDKFIAEKKIFGGEVIVKDYDYCLGDLNPFALEMKKFIKPSSNVKISRSLGGQCPNSKGTAVCIETLNTISGGNHKINEAIRYGHIELFSDEFETLSSDTEARMQWMISIVQKVQDERDKRQAESDARMANLEKEWEKHRSERLAQMRAKRKNQAIIQKNGQKPQIKA